MKSLALLLCLAVGAGCGPSLNPNFDGAWSGTTTVAVPGQAPQASPSQVLISTKDDELTIANLCFDRLGSVTMKGDGDSVTWIGNYTCNPVQFGSCGAVVATFKSFAIELHDNKALHLRTDAVLVGCGSYLSATLTFDGRK